MKTVQAFIKNGAIQNAKGTKVNTKRAISKAAQAAIAAKAALAGAKSKGKKIAKVVENAFKVFSQAYRAWKTLDAESYRGQGHGTIANLRGKIGLRKVAQRASGQSVFLHKDEQGYGFTWGKAIDTNTMQCGQVQVQFDAKQIVARFDSYGAFVKHVQRKGELNVQGVAEWKALSNGGRYVLYTNGKQVLRHEGSGTASGSYHNYQATGKLHGKFVTGKL